MAKTSPFTLKVSRTCQIYYNLENLMSDQVCGWLLRLMLTNKTIILLIRQALILMLWWMLHCLSIVGEHRGLLAFTALLLTINRPFEIKVHFPKRQIVMRPAELDIVCSDVSTFYATVRVFHPIFSDARSTASTEVAVGDRGGTLVDAKMQKHKYPEVLICRYLVSSHQSLSFPSSNRSIPRYESLKV